MGYEYGIESCGTIRSNRLREADLSSKSEMKKQWRSYIDWRIEKLSLVSVIKWYDNKAAHLHPFNFAMYVLCVPAHE